MIPGKAKPQTEIIGSSQHVRQMFSFLHKTKISGRTRAGGTRTAERPRIPSALSSNPLSTKPLSTKPLPLNRPPKNPPRPIESSALMRYNK